MAVDLEHLRKLNIQQVIAVGMPQTPSQNDPQYDATMVWFDMLQEIESLRGELLRVSHRAAVQAIHDKGGVCTG